jgi:spore germination protein YaaH
VSIAVSVTDYNDVFDGPAIKNYVDYLMIMAYFWDDNSPLSGPIEPMLQDDHSELSVTTGINYWKNTETIPTNKILLGVPYYGFDRYTASSDRLSSADGRITWVYLNDVPGYNHNRYFDSTWKTPWQVWQEGNQWHQLQYEDVESLSYKYDKVNSDNLAGIGIWTINYGSNRADLWQLIRDKFTI